MKAAVVCANEDVQFRECFTMEYTFIRSYLDMNSPEMLWRSEKVSQR